MEKNSFIHPALDLQGTNKLVYTAFSKHFFYLRMHISKFVLNQQCVPINPFLLFDYFLLDTVDQNIIRNADNACLKRSDEIWVFGPVSNGVLAEICIAKKETKPIRYFSIDSFKFTPISQKEVQMEEEVKSFHHLILEKD